MSDTRKYPISENKFKELLEPTIKKWLQNLGRTVKVSHYKFFCGVLYVLRTGVSWGSIFQQNMVIDTLYMPDINRCSESDFFGIYFINYKT